MLSAQSVSPSPVLSGERRNLLDVDAARLGRSSLGNADGEDAILETGLDAVLVDTGGEREGTGETAADALGDPVGVVWILLLGGLLDDLGGFGLGTLLLDGGLVRGVLDGGLLGGAVELLGAGAFLVVDLGAAGHDQGVLVGEFDRDVLLLDARQLTLEHVGVFDLFEVEARGEEAFLALLRVGLAPRHLAVGQVVDQGEERREVVLTRDGGAPVVGGWGEAREAAKRHDASFGW